MNHRTAALPILLLTNPGDPNIVKPHGQKRMIEMKKYIRAVNKHLNLPPEIRRRVMCDFVSTINAMRGSGMSDEAIIRELGTAKEAAAAYNERMKAFAYRKSSWRFAFAAMAVIGAVELLGYLAAWFAANVLGGISFPVTEAATVGIIGGADGPTAIFVTAAVGPVSDLLWMMILMIVGIWGYLRLRRCRQKR